jgi:twin BRCT domain
MLANDRWISPRCHLLHYPLVRGGMSEMKSMVYYPSWENCLHQIMTVTNYQGEARAYLEKLIEACGAKFTRNMTTANTHLIAARYHPLDVVPSVLLVQRLMIVKTAISANTHMIGESMW